MKVAPLFIAIFAIALLLIPMMGLGVGVRDTAPAADAIPHSPAVPQTPAPGGPSPDRIPEDSAWEEVATAEELEASLSMNGVSSFRILDQFTGQVETVLVRDYIRGAVAAEMPVSFHPEALKAQAVAAHTYALYNHYLQQRSPDPSLLGADFAADPSHMLVYITEETAKAFYGDNGDLYWGKICAAADSVAGYIMEYGDEPIVAAYHAISAGQTEAAANVWLGDAPYLQATDSGWDLLAPNYETNVLLSDSAVGNLLRTAYPSAQLGSDPAGWFSSIQRSDSGYITSVDVGGVELHGKDLRTLFDLRSHNMDISYDAANARFTFTTYGYGHGVGLSQYGADFMARQGYTFDEILRNYYTGVTLKEIDIDI